MSGHPITPYEPDLKFLVSARLVDVGGPKPSAPAGERAWTQGKPATVAGLVLEIRRRPNRVTLILDDRSARLEVSLYEEIFQQFRDIIVKDAILIVEGTLRFDDFIEAWRLQAKTLMDIDRARERFARRLWLRWPEEFDGPHGMSRFEELLKPYLKGPCGLSVADQPRAILGTAQFAGRLVGACRRASFWINYRPWWAATAGIWCMVRGTTFAARKPLHGDEFSGI